MKQTPVCVLCDWLISNSTLKGDVERWMSKDSRYARNTERDYKTLAEVAITNPKPKPKRTLYLGVSEVWCFRVLIHEECDRVRQEMDSFVFCDRSSFGKLVQVFPEKRFTVMYRK